MAKEDLKLVESAKADVNLELPTPTVKVEVTAERGVSVSGHNLLSKGDVADMDVNAARVLLAEGSVKPATE